MSNFQPSPDFVDIVRQDSERLQALYAINDMLRQVEAEGLDLEAILPKVLSVAVQQLEAHDGSIIIVNERLEIEHGWLENRPAVYDRGFLADIVKDGLAGWVLRHKQASIINDTRNDDRWLPRKNHRTTEASWSVICTPFIIRNRAIGAITIHKKGTNQFDSRDMSLLMAISSQAASTIENARLLANSRRQLRVSTFLNDASRVINSSLDIDEILRLLLAQVNEFINAEAISIALVDSNTNELVYAVADGVGGDQIVGMRLPSNQGISGWVMQNATPALVDDPENDPRFDLKGDRRTGHKTIAMMCAPIQHKGHVLGTIQAINPTQGGFSRQDFELFVNLANIASSAVANAQQFQRTQEAEARYTGLFQDTIDPIILTDLEGQVIEANRRAFTFFGYEREELMARTLLELMDEHQDMPPIQTLSVDSVKVFSGSALTKRDKVIPVEVYIKRTAETGDGLSDTVQWIFHDIAKQVELEQMRQDLTAMLFHDLQSPLGNVISSLELIRFDLEANSSPTMQAMMEIALRSSERLQTLIRSLLDINRLEAGHPIREQRTVNIRDIVEEVHEIERANLERRFVNYVIDIPTNIEDVYIDPDMIKRVLGNLVNNALKYSDNSHSITISAAVAPDAPQMQICVTDQGPGIPQRFRKSIFEKYRRVEGTSSKGLGLGLAFCRLAVEAHGGRIWVDEGYDDGARFCFTLPLATEEVPA